MGFSSKNEGIRNLKLIPMNKPIQIESGEWYFKGCFIQNQEHPALSKYHVFKDTEQQETIDTCNTMVEAKKLCRLNEVINPYLGLSSFM